jgi:hypothetical protein
MAGERCAAVVEVVEDPEAHGFLPRATRYYGQPEAGSKEDPASPTNTG